MLSLSQLSELSQVVSAIAVVLSLVYVGYQIRQNTQATRAVTGQSIAQTDSSYVGATLEPLSLAEPSSRSEFIEQRSTQ
jgi:hypothetical protein